ncbi:MAG TPA: DUF3850 domain-containing protein [Candidatus Nanoarchaeia archaeon]|nr:DUF3850 domain-containing protein [Candidatus Nanoarchaeia archaeon]
MATVTKKVWPKFFELLLSGEKQVELRLADFDLAPGDTLVLKEFDPETQAFTGRKITKTVNRAIKVNPAEMYSLDEIETYGFYLIDFA